MVLPSASQIRRLPKADLHSHIDGSVPAGELFAIARRHGRKLLSPTGKGISSAGEFTEFIRGPGYATLLDDIVSRFSPIIGIMQTEGAIRDVGLAYVGELKKQNVIYAEGRFAPQYHVTEGLTYDKVVECMAEGLAEGAERYGIRTNLIVAIGREASPAIAREVVRAASRNSAVVALDLGGTEQANPPEKFRSAFSVAAARGLKKTVHAGEGAGSVDANLKNVRAAVTELGANRIGHAIDLAKDEDLVQLLLKRSVAVEMNPVSNLVLGKIHSTTDLHIERLLASGVCVSVNSDDPALWRSGTINDVLRRVCADYAFSISDLDGLIANSFRSAFTTEREKRYLLDEYESARRRLS